MSEHIDAYANALFEVARAEGNLATVEDELFKVARTVEANDDLRATLTDQHIPVAKRQEIAESLLGGRATPGTTALVSFVIGSGRARELGKIIDSLVAKAAAERQTEVAEVRSAMPLDDEQRRRLAAALEKATGKKVALKVTVDKSLMGGIVAQVGDTVLDGSVAERLRQLREKL